MRFRTFAIALALVAAAVGAPAAGSAANGAHTAGVSHRVGVKDHFRLTFDLGETLRAGTLVRDATGHGHGARVLVAKRGHLTVEKGIAGHGAGFPGGCAACGRAIIQMPDRLGLDPGIHAFNYGAATKVTPAQAARDTNVVQKGYFHQQGGQWKLQINGHFPSCVISGTGGRLKVTGTVGVADGKWHTVICRRSPTGLTVTVDGAVRGRTPGHVGKIASTAPVRIGGKKAVPGNEQFHGDLDNVFLHVSAV